MAVDWRKVTGKTLPLEEREWLRNIAKAVSSQFDSPVIVNIGIYRYATMYCLRAGAPEAVLWGVDIKKPPPPPDKQLKPHVVVANSQKYHTKFNDEIHLLFIDGDHRYQAVKGDIEGWAPKVVPGGVIAFHDYAPTPYHLQLLPELEGVRRAIEEWQETAQWQRLKASGSLAGFRRP